MNGQKLVILIAEDSDADVFFVRRVLEQADVPHSLQHVADGDHAIAYLGGQKDFADREKYPMPTLMLCDIRMPLCDGFEVLVWVRSQPQFATLPFIMLSTSALESDRSRAIELGATAYLTKDILVTDPAKLVTLLSGLC